MKLRIAILIIGLVTLLLSACDPYCSITITNDSSETAQILVKENIHFRTIKQKSLSTADGYNLYILLPNERIKVGAAIAEIDDDLPFNEISIIKNQDTLSAKNLESIKRLFDRITLNRLKKPYNISIK